MIINDGPMRGRRTTSNVVHYLIWLMFSKGIDKEDGETDGLRLEPEMLEEIFHS